MSTASGSDCYFGSGADAEAEAAERKLGMKKLVRRDKIPGIRFFYVIGGRQRAGNLYDTMISLARIKIC